MTSERRTSSLRCPARVAGSNPLEIQSLIVAALTRISLAISVGVSHGSSQSARSRSAKADHLEKGLVQIAQLHYHS